jgi:hypothetical protein
VWVLWGVGCEWNVVWGWGVGMGSGDGEWGWDVVWRGCHVVEKQESFTCTSTSRLLLLRNNVKRSFLRSDEDEGKHKRS